MMLVYATSVASPSLPRDPARFQLLYQKDTRCCLSLTDGSDGIIPVSSDVTIYPVYSDYDRIVRISIEISYTSSELQFDL